MSRIWRLRIALTCAALGRDAAEYKRIARLIEQEKAKP